MLVGKCDLKCNKPVEQEYLCFKMICFFQIGSLLFIALSCAGGITYMQLFHNSNDEKSNQGTFLNSGNM